MAIGTARGSDRQSMHAFDGGARDKDAHGSERPSAFCARQNCPSPGGSLPVRMEPRGRPAERRDGHREGCPCPALSQPHVVRAGLPPRDATGRLPCSRVHAVADRVIRREAADSHQGQGHDRFSNRPDRFVHSTPPTSAVAITGPTPGSFESRRHVSFVRQIVRAERRAYRVGD